VSQRRLTAEQASLLMIACATVSLMGVPGFGHYESPTGPLTGVVLGPSGRGLSNVEVALFDDARSSLVELTTTDRNGRFAFLQAPRRFDVFASRPNDPRWCGSWVLDRRLDTTSALELHLSPGRALDLRVTDARGGPLARAEVRVLDTGAESAVVARLATDEDGRCRVHVPRHADVMVLPPAGEPALALCLLAEMGSKDVPKERTVVLPDARLLSGVVRSASGDAPEEDRAGRCVVAWDPTGSTWLGWTVTNEEGRWRMAVPAEEVLLRIADPTGRTLAWEGLVRVDDGSHELAPVLAAERGLRIGTPAEPIAARVWLLDEGTGVWSWGRRTDREGRLATSVPDPFSVVAVPSSGARPLEAWDRAARDGPLQLVDENADRVP